LSEENEETKGAENEQIKDEDGGLRQSPPPGACQATNVTYSPTIISTPRFSKHIFSHVPGTCEKIEFRPLINRVTY
jgi:hypothetical protein